MRRTLLIAAIAASGCAWGVRGGVAAQAISTRAVSAQGELTGAVGFGSTSSSPDRYSAALLVTGSVEAGADTDGGPVLLGLTGIEYFAVPERQGVRLGFHAGAEHGLRGSGADLRVLDYVVLLRGGPLLRLSDRVEPSPLLTLSLDATAGGALSLDVDRSSAFIGGIAVNVGFLRIGRFHL